MDKVEDEMKKEDDLESVLRPDLTANRRRKRRLSQNAFMDRTSSSSSFTFIFYLPNGYQKKMEEEIVCNRW